MKLSVLVVAVGLALTAPSYALVITTTATSSAKMVTDGVAATDDKGPAGEVHSDIQAQVSMNVFDQGISGRSAAYAAGAGQLGASSEAFFGGSNPPEIYYSSDRAHTVALESRVLQTTTITNDSATAQSVSYDFLFAAGVLTPDGNYQNGWVSWGNSAGYSADIRVNGTSQWSSSFAVASDSNYEHNVTHAGTLLAAQNYVYNQYAQQSYWDGSYVWSDYNQTLNLGMLGAGQSLTVEYELRTFADFETDGFGYSRMPSVRVGDPYNFNATPPVPEPETVAMFGVGLAGLAFRSRSRKTKVNA